MSRHGKAYTMAYTAAMSRRGYKTGSLFQRCEARYGCPPLVDGPPHPETGKPTKVRPSHTCKGRWFGMIEDGVTADGERKRRTVSGATKSVVKRRLDALNLEKAKGGVNAKRTTTVSRWAEAWLEMISNEVRPASLTTDKAAVKKVNATIGHKKLAELEPSDVRAVAAAIRREGGSSSTALRYQGSLMRLLTAATQEGYAVPSNVLLAKKPTAAVNDRDAMNLDQCLSVVEYLTRRDDSGALLLPRASRWVLALLQGTRQGETLGLTWADGIDLAVPSLTVAWQVQSLPYRIPRDPSSGFVIPDGYEVRHLVGTTHLVRPKSDAGWRTMPLIPWAEAAVSELQATAEPNPHGLLYPGRVVTSSTSRRGKVHAAQTWPRNRASDRDEWFEIQRAARVAHPTGRPFHVHEIRHSTATLLLALGVPEAVRIAIMGHSTVASTKTYEHVDLGPMLSALRQLGTELGLPSPERSLEAAAAISGSTQP